MMSTPDSASLEVLFQEEVYALPGKVLVIVRDWEATPDQDRQLLTKILGSVKLALGAVQIVNMEIIDFDRIEVLQPAYVISFGPAMKDLPSRYEIIVIQDTKIIQADALGDLNDVNKKNLWNALKQLFSV